jgi:hypothetical protein
MRTLRHIRRESPEGCKVEGRDMGGPCRVARALHACFMIMIEAVKLGVDFPTLPDYACHRRKNL